MANTDISERQMLINDLLRLKDRYRRSAVRWKVSYRLLLILSAILSAAAAIITQISPEDYQPQAKVLAVVFPATVTVIATIIATLDFDTNWRVNRTARHHIDMLLIDLGDPDCDLNNIRLECKRIIQMRLDAFEKSD